MIIDHNFLKLVNELLKDHADLFNNVFPAGFSKPKVDEEYSLDLRQRVIRELERVIYETGENK